MEKKYLFLLPALILMFSFTFVSALEGSGTVGDPYIISDCGKLQELNSDPSAYYLITNDIDCSDTVNWNGGAGFTPIFGFTGNLNGQGYTISDLFISQPSATYIGLVSVMNGGAIFKLNLENVDITGNSRVGGLVGKQNSGHIEGCSVTGNVLGYSYVGGLVGEHGGGESITGCYSRATVTASSIDSSYIGGLVGLQGSSYTEYSYSSGITYFSAECLNCGGLMGGDFVSATSHSFYDSNNTEYPNSIGTGKTTEEMKDINTYLDDGWTITASSNNLNDGYPYLVGYDWFIYVYEEPEPEQTVTGVGSTLGETDSLITGGVIEEQEEEPTQIEVINFFQKIWNWFKGLFK